MSDEKEPTLEFSAFDLMPEWAQESRESGPAKKHSPSTDEPRQKRSARRGRRDEGGFERRGGRRDGGRHEGGRHEGGGRRDDRRDDRRRGGPGGDRRGGGDSRRRPHHRGDDRGRRPRDEDFQIKGINLRIEPTREAVQSLARHIKDTVRVYPMADLAKMIAHSRDRYQIRIRSEKGGPPLFQCHADGSTWLSMDEAISHLLRSEDILKKFYTVEEVALDPPKGNFPTIAVCGFSGEILGPPNRHEYQGNIARLHRERFANMSLERFKSRIEMRSDEETLEAWKEQMSKSLHYRLAPESPEEPAPQEEAAGAAPSGEETPPAEPAPEEREESPASEPAISGEETAPAAEETPEAPVEEASAAADGTAPGEESPEPKGEAEGEAEAEAEGEADAEATPEPEPEPAKEPEEAGLLLKTPEELQRHFRENFAEKEIKRSFQIIVPGNIPGKMLSPDLLQLIKNEGNKVRRGFPFELFQLLCNQLEKEGLKFFKRGKKALHVSLVRPQGISPNLSLTDRVQKIIDLVSSTPKITVVDILEKMCPDFQKPDPRDREAKLDLSDEAKGVLGDIRWLTTEGFVMEFPDTRLELGKRPVSEAPKKGPPARKTGGEKPVNEKPVEEKPVEEKPVEEKPVEEKPVEEKPVEEKPVEEKPVEPAAATSDPVTDAEEKTAAEPEAAEESETPEEETSPDQGPTKD